MFVSRGGGNNYREFGGLNNHFVDPQFNDPANPPVTEESLKAIKNPASLVNKYMPKDGSPAVGKGKDVPWAKQDYNGNAFANPRSLGAFERKR